MKKTYLYKCGLPFSERLNDNIKDLIKRIDGKKASLIIIDGGIGEGKTTLGTEIVDEINKQRGLDKTDLSKNCKQIAMGGEDFRDKMEYCAKNKIPAVVYDEAGDFNKRGVLTGFNAMMNRIFETYRAFRILVVLCLPNFNVLDNSLFDKNIPRLLLHCYARNDKQGNFKAYSIWRMHYLRHNMKKAVVKTQAFNFVDCNFFGHFLDLTPDRSKLLEKLSTGAKFESIKKSGLKYNNLISTREISKRLNKSLKSIYCLMQNKDIKPSKKISGKNYFDKSVLEELK